MSVLDRFPSEIAGSGDDAVGVIASAERGAWASLGRLSDIAPWTPGTFSRASRVQSALTSMLAVPGGRLDRTLRGQKVPWHPDDEPLKSTLLRLAGLTDEAAEICEVASAVGQLKSRLETLERSFAGAVPNAWRRTVVYRGLGAGDLDLLLSLDEVRAADQRLRLAADGLERWKGEIERWLVEMLDHATAGQGTGAPSVDVGDLEDRYELLLSVSAADRSPRQEATAALFRSTIVEQIRSAATSAQAHAGDAAFELVTDYAMASVPTMSPEEIGTYRASLRHYYELAVRRQSNA